MFQNKIYLAFIWAFVQFCFSGSAAADIGTSCEKDLTTITRAGLLERIRQDLRDPRKAVHLQDARMLHYLDTLKAHGAVTLAVGNSTRVNRSANLQRYEDLARQIAQSGRYVFYDADASTAAAIQQGAGKMAVGISASETNSPGQPLIVPLHNEHMRLSAFGDDTTVIAGTDSLVGLALTLFRKAQFVFPTDGRWTNPLAQWSRRLNSEGQNLGIRFNDVPTFQSKDQLRLQVLESPAADTFLPPTYSRLKKDVLQSVLLHADDMAQLEAQLETVTDGGNDSGMVVFGSSQVDPHSAALTYDVSYAFGRRGIRGTSGGAGGTMWVVNAGFFDAGAESVGVPIVGRNQLMSETRVHTEVQTLSVGTPGYHIRVYGLLKNQGLVAFAPGGSGTMRELAATLLLFAASPARDTLVGFIHDGYNRELYDMLMTLPLPKAFKRRVIPSLTADSPDVLSRHSFSISKRLRSAAVPEPRSVLGFHHRQF